ncbi:MAG: hypothetical protein V4479_08590 [Actinomycetota bacterium]
MATQNRTTGVGRVLVVVYGILAVAATGRSVFQIIDRFGLAPVAFILSAVSAIVYIVATVALVAPGIVWYRVALATISFELLGVLVVGTITVVAPDLIGVHSNDAFGTTATVWSSYGLGYLLVPLVLPVLGLVYLRSRGRAAAQVA